MRTPLVAGLYESSRLGGFALSAAMREPSRLGAKCEPSRLGAFTFNPISREASRLGAFTLYATSRETSRESLLLRDFRASCDLGLLPLSSFADLLVPHGSGADLICLTTGGWRGAVYPGGRWRGCVDVEVRSGILKLEAHTRVLSL